MANDAVSKGMKVAAHMKAPYFDQIEEKLWPEAKMNDFLSRYLHLVTQPRFSDLFSYNGRTNKRLLRCALRLADDVSKSSFIRDDAIIAEVWFACTAPVMQGYWRSKTPEKKKKKVLDTFHTEMLNIIVNDVFMSTNEFQQLGSDAQNIFISTAHNDFQEKLEARTNEYTDAIGKFLNCSSTPNPMPTELVEALMHNLFDGTESPTRISSDYATENSPRFMDVLMLVALPMVSTFIESMKG